MTTADLQDLKVFALFVEAYHAMHSFLCWVT